MQKHFVRTIFWGCTQNLHLATGLIYFWEAGRNAKYLTGASEMESKHLILGS